MFIANELKKTKERPNNNDFREGILYHIEEVITNFIADKPMFHIEDFSAVYFDEYTLKTNCHNDIVSTLYLVIDQPNNYKLDKLSIKSKIGKDKIKMPDLYFSLEDIKKGILNGLVGHLDSNNILWENSNSILLKSTDYNEEYGINNYYIRIIPCIAYYNKENVKGVMYLVSNQTQIEYPDIAIENFYIKNERTNDIYRQVVLMIKNILLKDKSIEKLPSEIIETILFNVPDEIYKDDSYDTLIKVINFIRNKSLKEIIALDKQDYALTSIYRSMSAFYVKHIIKLIEKYLINNK